MHSPSENETRDDQPQQSHHRKNGKADHWNSHSGKEKITSSTEILDKVERETSTELKNLEKHMEEDLMMMMMGISLVL